MTRAEIEELEAWDKKASPPPWAVVFRTDPGEPLRDDVGEVVSPEGRVCRFGSRGPKDPSPYDLVILCMARNALPLLLEEIGRLQDTLEGRDL